MMIISHRKTMIDYQYWVWRSSPGMFFEIIKDGWCLIRKAAESTLQPTAFN
jgi:hypothetical protein